MRSSVGATIRRANLADLVDVASVYVESWLSAPPNDLDPSSLPDEELGRLCEEYRDHWEDILRAGRDGVWLADVEGTAAGIVQRGLSKRGSVHLQSLYVVPRFHGYRVGEQLMVAALAGLPAGTRVSLEVAQAARAAIELYRKLGFIEVGPLEPSPLVAYPSGEAVPALIMEKTI